VAFHLADVELVWGYRFRQVFVYEAPDLSPFEPEAWAASLHYRQRPWQEALALFRALRRGNLELLAAFPPQAWERAGRHPRWGACTVAQVVLHLADHDLLHLEQVRQLRRALGL